MFNKYFPIVYLALLANIEVVFSVKSPKVSTSIFDKVEKLKTSNTYEYHYHNESTFDPTLGYVESAKTLLEEFKVGKIPVDNLNKFEDGLKQYFLTKELEEVAKGTTVTFASLYVFQFLFKVFFTKEHSSAITFEDYSDGTVSYDHVILNGVPSLSLMGDQYPEVYYEGLSLNHTSKLNVTLKLDKMIFTGNAVVDNFKYNFTYDIKDAVISWYIELSRNPIAFRHAEMKIQFSTDEFLITSSNAPHKSDALLVDIVKKNFLQSLLNNYFIEFTFDTEPLFLLASVFAGMEMKFTEAYRAEILSGIVESATTYINSKGLNTFKVAPFNHSVEAGSIKLEQFYKDIEVKGLLNFVKYEAKNLVSTWLSIITDEFSDALLLTYLEDGEKQAFISYVMVDPSGENVQQFRVKTISISTTYAAAFVDDRIQLARSRNGSLNGGFLVKFELDNSNSYNEELITHIENVIARSLDGFVSN